MVWLVWLFCPSLFPCVEKCIFVLVVQAPLWPPVQLLGQRNLPQHLLARPTVSIGSPPYHFSALRPMGHVLEEI